MIPKPPEPAWKGPYKNGPQSGVTQSLLNRFLECPFKFYLYAYCGLKDPKPPHENLPWGSIIHKGLEHLIAGASLHDSFQAMHDYFHSAYPERDTLELYTCMEMLKLYDVSPFRDWPNLQTEQYFEEEIHLSLPRRLIWARGLMDVKAQNRLCDHKAKGSIYPTETSEELAEDLQMNMYAYIAEAEYWQYDLIKCPLTAYACPTRIPGYSAQAFAHHLFHKFSNPKYNWPIASFRPFWVSQLSHFQPRTTNEAYFRQVLSPLIHRLCDWWEYVTHPTFNPNESTHWNSIFYKMPIRIFLASKTDKYKGDYRQAIIDQDYTNLEPVTSYFSELEE